MQGSQIPPGCCKPRLHLSARSIYILHTFLGLLGRPFIYCRKAPPSWENNWRAGKNHKESRRSSRTAAMLVSKQRSSATRTNLCVRAASSNGSPATMAFQIDQVDARPLQPKHRSNPQSRQILGLYHYQRRSFHSPLV